MKALHILAYSVFISRPQTTHSWNGWESMTRNKQHTMEADEIVRQCTFYWLWSCAEAVRKRRFSHLQSQNYKRQPSSPFIYMQRAQLSENVVIIIPMKRINQLQSTSCMKWFDIQFSLDDFKCPSTMTRTAHISAIFLNNRKWTTETKEWNDGADTSTITIKSNKWQIFVQQHSIYTDSCVIIQSEMNDTIVSCETNDRIMDVSAHNGWWNECEAWFKCNDE